MTDTPATGALAASVRRDDSLTPEMVRALLHADHTDPFAVLGMHADSGSVTIRVLQPGASRVRVQERRSGEIVAELPRMHAEGLFAGRLGLEAPFDYRLEVTWGEQIEIIEDPYAFGPVLGELDIHLLAEGRHLQLYRVLGAHPRVHEGVAGVSFAVWAPNARRVSLVGDFNDWDGRRHVLRRRQEIGIWEIFIPGLAAGALYKYEILGPDGHRLPLKADPVAFAAQRPPETASRVHGLVHHEWQDAAWMKTRAERDLRAEPMSIYEVHLGSWRRELGEGGRYLTYRELAEQLVPYVKELGFTHIELMPVSEYPFDGSWGYQPTGMYAATSRFGEPEDLAYLIDRCHQAGIGVLIDWVPGHFPADPHGLGLFDGTHLYEHADPRQGFHQDWNTLIYNYGRNEVRNFLVANALFWLDQYHIDGLRVDAVASMLYLDYSRNAGEWVPNRYGGRENLEAIDFLKETNELVFGSFPGATTIAEESTAWPAVSRPTYAGGLGFGFKWNMGWMHDTLEFVRHDPVYRRHHYHQLTFGLVYAFSENFVLPLSHDEVVHGKGSLIGKQPGDRWQRFASLRSYYGFMFTHPGKKLLFMGAELAQEREWNHDRGLDWHLLDDDLHRGVQRLIRDLNHLYAADPALHRLDCEAEGFEWIEASDPDNTVLAYVRRAEAGGLPTVIVCNFTPIVRRGYRLGVPVAGRYRERLNTDGADYGGSNVGNGGGIETEAVAWHGRQQSLCLTLPPLATLVLTAEP